MIEKRNGGNGLDFALLLEYGWVLLVLIGLEGILAADNALVMAVISQPSPARYPPPKSLPARLKREEPIHTPIIMQSPIHSLRFFFLSSELIPAVFLRKKDLCRYKAKVLLDMNDWHANKADGYDP